MTSIPHASYGSNRGVSLKQLLDGRPAPGCDFIAVRPKIFSTLRPHQPVRMLRTQNMMVHVSYPLAARHGHVEVFHSVIQMHGHVIPEKSRVFVDDIGWR